MTVIDRLKCAFLNHTYEPDRAVDYDPEGYTRLYRDGSEKPLPSCRLIEKCRRCGKERDIASPVHLVERWPDVELAWEKNNE